MKTFSERAALLQRVRRVLRRRYGRPKPEATEDVARQLLRFLLLEHSTAEQVDDALARIDKEFVDLNELRVSLAREIADAVPGMPDGLHKAVTATKLLNALFLKHNSMEWDFVRTMGVRELRQYFETAPGGGAVIGAAAVMLFSPGHAVPADADVCRVLQRLDLVEPEEDVPSVQAFLERALTRDQGYETWALLRRVAETACIVRSPLCSRCPIKAMCKAGQERLAAEKVKRAAKASARKRKSAARPKGRPKRAKKKK